jgi:hypothetical protein
MSTSSHKERKPFQKILAVVYGISFQAVVGRILHFVKSKGFI